MLRKSYFFNELNNIVRESLYCLENTYITPDAKYAVTKTIKSAKISRKAKDTLINAVKKCHSTSNVRKYLLKLLERKKNAK